MASSELPKIVKGIIKQRKLLMRRNISYLNPAKCHLYIKELTTYIEAYDNKWSIEGWKKFINNNISKITFLIPENTAGTTIKTKLYENL